MRQIVTTAVLAFTVALAGCSSNADVDVDNEGVEQTAEALSSYGKTLVGSWQLQKNQQFGFDDLVLKANGKYLTTNQVVCITAPCPALRETGKFSVIAPAGRKKGELRL